MKQIYEHDQKVWQADIESFVRLRSAVERIDASGFSSNFREHAIRRLAEIKNKYHALKYEAIPE